MKDQACPRVADAILPLALSLSSTNCVCTPYFQVRFWCVIEIWLLWQLIWSFQDDVWVWTAWYNLPLQVFAWFHTSVYLCFVERKDDQMISNVSFSMRILGSSAFISIINQTQEGSFWEKIIDNKIYYDLFLRLPSSFYHIFLLFLISVIKGHHWNIHHFTELMRGTCKWKNNRINLKYYDGEEYRSETSNTGYLTVFQKRNSEHDLFTY